MADNFWALASKQLGNPDEVYVKNPRTLELGHRKTQSIWERDPEEHLARYSGSGAGDLADAAQEHYGTLDPKAIAESYHREIGLSPYRLGVDLNSSALAKENDQNAADPQLVAGRYHRDTHQVAVEGRLSPEDKAATVMHELSHAADHLENGFSSASVKDNPALHHQDFANFEPEMAQSMWTQAALEHGLPVNQEILRRYPWLNQVNPQSSNQLTNPWASMRKPDPELFLLR